MTTVISEFGFLMTLEFHSSGLHSVLMVVRAGNVVLCSAEILLSGFVLFLPCLLTHWYFLTYIFNFGDHVFCFLGFFLPHCSACGILVPWAGIKPVHPSVGACSPKHWSNVFIYCGRGLNNKYKMDIVYPGNHTGACTQHHGWLLIFVSYFFPCLFSI